MRASRPVQLVFTACALLLAGCAGDDAGEPTGADTAAPPNTEDAEDSAPHDDTDDTDDPASRDDYVLDEPTPLQIGAIPGGQGFVLFVMEQQGIAEDYNLDLQVEDFLNPGALHTALAEKAVDVGFGGLEPIALAREQGRDVVIFNILGGPPTLLVTPADSGIESMADLGGARVGSFSGNSGATFSILTAIGREEHGVDLADEAEIVDAAPPALVGLLERGDLDAALLDTVFSIRAMMDDSMRALAQVPTDYSEYVGGHPAHVVMTSNEEFIDANEDVIVAFNAAYEDTMEYISNNPETWAQFAEDAEIEGDDAPGVIRDFLEPTYVTTWDEEQLATQEALLEILIDIGAQEGGLTSIPEDLFRLDLQPGRWTPEGQ